MQVSAAKLHVLHLDPIKAKLGPRWGKLSDLVHRLFETALHKAQGPRDKFILVDDLSYVVTFHGLSIEEAGLACASIARNVCELLFGTDAQDITVRALVGQVPAGALSVADPGGKLSRLLEQTGREILVSFDTDENAAQPPRAMASGDEIAHARELAARRNMQLGLLPVWDLNRRRSVSLFLSLMPQGAIGRFSTRLLLAEFPESHVAGMEIALLRAAARYAQNVRQAAKASAIGTSVSYETLCGHHSRIDYLDALRSVRTHPTCPILLRIEKVPGGTPPGRLAEIVAMLHAPNVKVTAEFLSLHDIAELDIRLGVTGIGWEVPPQCDPALVAMAAHKLAQRATAQKAFAFLHGLATPELLAAAHDVRFGSGAAIHGDRPLTDMEAIPDFPLIAS